ncbi:MAG: hypothetical protein ACD_5C00146G0001 [uncultured bacterium]|nr:MAG: hypothetical protein ACD_5C00146G0001 [uncultured bacterium]
MLVSAGRADKPFFNATAATFPAIFWATRAASVIGGKRGAFEFFKQGASL